MHPAASADDAQALASERKTKTYISAVRTFAGTKFKRDSIHSMKFREIEFLRPTKLKSANTSGQWLEICIEQIKQHTEQAKVYLAVALISLLFSLLVSKERSIQVRLGIFLASILINQLYFVFSLTSDTKTALRLFALSHIHLFVAFVGVVFLKVPFHSPSDSSFNAYVLHSAIFCGCYGAIIFTLAYILNRFKGRFHDPIYSALNGSLMTGSTFFGLMLFQWAFMLPSKGLAFEVGVLGVAFPIFSSAFCRIILSDLFAFGSIVGLSDFPDEVEWKTGREMLVRYHFISAAKLLTSVPGILGILALEEHTAFIISTLTSNTVEILSAIAQFGALGIFTGGARDEGTPCSETKLTSKGLMKSFVSSFSKVDAGYRFALSSVIEEMCEKATVVASTVLLCVLQYSMHGKLPWVQLLRGAFMILFELVLVDPIKVLVLHRAFNIPFVQINQGASSNFNVSKYYVGIFFKMIISLSLFMYTYFLRLEYDLTNSF